MNIEIRDRIQINLHPTGRDTVAIETASRHVWIAIETAEPEMRTVVHLEPRHIAKLIEGLAALQPAAAQVAPGMADGRD